MSIELFCALAELHEWETTHHVALKTAVGRALYFGIVDALLNYKKIDQTSLKQLVNSSVATDRGVRLRIREFEKIGLIRVKSNALDKRTRQIEVTEKFVELMAAHANQCEFLIQKRFILINTNKDRRMELDWLHRVAEHKG